MAGLFEGNIDQTVDLIAKGIEQTLAKEIERKFQKMIDPLIRDLAIEYAQRVSVNLESFENRQSGSIHLTIKFNDENIHDETKSR